MGKLCQYELSCGQEEVIVACKRRQYYTKTLVEEKRVSKPNKTISPNMFWRCQVFSKRSSTFSSGSVTSAVGWIGKGGISRLSQSSAFCCLLTSWTYAASTTEQRRTACAIHSHRKGSPHPAHTHTPLHAGRFLFFFLHAPPTGINNWGMWRIQNAQQRWKEI